MASMSELDRASEREGSTKMSIARSQEATSAVAGTKTQSLRMPRAPARAWSEARIGPLPTIANFMPARVVRRQAKASSSVGKPFSGRNAQTVPITSAPQASARGREHEPARKSSRSIPFAHSRIRSAGTCSSRSRWRLRNSQFTTIASASRSVADTSLR
jgi:hypothetical protein